MPREKKLYTTEQLQELKAAKEVVKKYWISSYEEIYGILSSKEKERLNFHEGIKNATEYKNSMCVTERVWMKQTYQKAEMDEYGYIQITVLSDWEEEGYMGEMAFIFDMLKEDGVWKIAHIMY
jgi:hypothetical protein